MTKKSTPSLEYQQALQKVGLALKKLPPQERPKVLKKFLDKRKNRSA